MLPLYFCQRGWWCSGVGRIDTKSKEKKKTSFHMYCMPGTVLSDIYSLFLNLSFFPQKIREKLQNGQISRWRCSTKRNMNVGSQSESRVQLLPKNACLEDPSLVVSYRFGSRLPTKGHTINSNTHIASEITTNQLFRRSTHKCHIK